MEAQPHAHQFPLLSVHSKYISIYIYILIYIYIYIYKWHACPDGIRGNMKTKNIYGKGWVADAATFKMTMCVCVFVAIVTQLDCVEYCLHMHMKQPLVQSIRG